MHAHAGSESSRRHARIRAAVACTACAVGLLFARPAAAPFEMRLHVDASLRTNALYHLACLGGSLSCSRDIFQRFWNTRLQETAADRETVAAWQRLLAGIVARAPDMTPSPLLINAIPLHPDGLVRRQVMAGLIETTSVARLQRRAPGVTRTEAAELLRLVDRVEDRLRPWWRSEGERLAKARIQGVTTTAERNQMVQALGRMAQFLESAPADRDAYLHAIAPPEPESTDYSATAILNHLPIEVVAVARPDEIVEGAVHELGHYLYDSIRPDAHHALVNQFVAAGAPSIIGIYSYLHEAMAISAQGLYDDARASRSTEREDAGDTGYKHPYIPLLADVAVPLVRAAVARQEHLTGGFAGPYIAAALSKLGDRRNELPFVFAQVVLVTPSGNRAFADAFERTLFPAGSIRVDSLAKAAAFPETNLVQFSTYDELRDLQPAQLAGLREARRGFVYASRRGRSGYHLLVAGRTDADVVALVGRLGDVDALAAPGLVVEAD